MLSGKNNLVVDIGCCMGGNSIQMAVAGHTVLAVDICAPRLQLAAHNASLYGVRDRISFVAADILTMDTKNIKVWGWVCFVVGVYMCEKERESSLLCWYLFLFVGIVCHSLLFLVSFPFIPYYYHVFLIVIMCSL